METATVLSARPRLAGARERLSCVLERLARSETDALSVAQLMEALGERSFGGVMLALALPATLMPPVASGIFGAPLLLLSAQLLVARDRPWLPGRVGRMSLPRRGTSALLTRASIMVGRLETALRPRLGALLHPWHARFIAGGCMCLSIVLMLPAPIAHTAAGLGIASFAAGLVQRDGLALLVGWALTLCCGLLLGLMVFGALLGLKAL